MNHLWLTEEQAKQIAHHARDEAPLEACGLIAGEGIRARKVIPVENIASEPQTRFIMDPAALSKHLPALEIAGLRLLGFYHSHPNGEPIPSPTDLREVTYPDVAHVIVGLKHRKPRLAAWSVRHGRVGRVELHIGDHPPELKQDPPLSRAQQAAIIITALIAFSIVVVVSLHLLPPAPSITAP
jgi:proteasome lid subunit RPN8/RPN11